MAAAYIGELRVAELGQLPALAGAVGPKLHGYDRVGEKLVDAS